MPKPKSTSKFQFINPLIYQKHIFQQRLGLVSLIGVFILLGTLALFPMISLAVDAAHAADSSSASTTVTYDFAPTIDISLSKANVDFNIAANEFNKLKTDSLNVTVSTNNITGYTLNMATDSSATNGATIVTEESGFEAEQLNVATNALVNTANNRYYVPSITSSITNPTDSTFPVNSWAYSISDPSASPVNMVYSPLPAAGSSAEIKKVTELDFPTDGSEASVDDITPVTIATKADMSIPAGTYTNKLVFTAVTNYNPEYDNYTIIYNKNGTSGDGTSGTIGGDMSMVSHSVYTGDSITLYAPNYWRTGYGFLGWSFTSNATKYVPSTQTSLNTGEAYVYGPNETITITDDILDNANTDKTIQIYAIWKASEGNLQNWTGCNAMSVGDVTALTDTRDNNVYTIAKLADNKCWFAENLRLSNTATIDSTNTNNPASRFALPGSSNTWCTEETSACIDTISYNSNNTNSSLAASPNAISASSSWYSYGNYYSWAAATAGHGTSSIASGSTTGSICPIGWHLPTSGFTASDMVQLHLSYGGAGGSQTDAAVYNKFIKYPLNYTESGMWLGGTAIERANVGAYYSNSAYSSEMALDWGMSRNNSYMSGPGATVKYRGYAVRCVANTEAVDGVDYIYLADGSWWTKNSQGSATWANAATLCPSGTSLPTAEQFVNLLTAYGGAKNGSSSYDWRDGDADLYNATGWSGDHWSSTESASDTTKAWHLSVSSSSSYMSRLIDLKTYPLHVVCVKS